MSTSQWKWFEITFIFAGLKNQDNILGTICATIIGGG